MPSRRSGQVITFYSYKGGTGRTMALANVACLLAQQGPDRSKVLMIDWDLDAPGLHRYFRNNFSRHFAGQPSPEKALDDSPGLIDLFLELDRSAPRSIAEDPDQSEREAERLLANFKIGPFVLPTDFEGLWMLKAGSFTPDYGERVNTFRWEDLYHRCPALFTVFADWLASQYDYVLIDSRTGLSDISGICTMLMPEKLVVVFTPNRQSLEGVLEASRQAVLYRSRSDDLRPLAVFPLASRIEFARHSLRDAWRGGSSEMRIEGYQPAFQALFREIYGLHDCDLSNYFHEIQVQQSPDFAYGEEIAALVERGADRLSLTRVYQMFTTILVRRRSPWENTTEDASERAIAEKSRLAERAYTGLAPDNQKAAQRLLTRLVRLASPEEGGEDLPHRIRLDDLDGDFLRLARILADAEILVLRYEETTGHTYAELADRGLLRHWPRLRTWLRDDREFLSWRQSFSAKYLEWRRAGWGKALLLRGPALAEAESWLKSRPEEISWDEKSFVLSSRRRRLQSRLVLALAPVLLLVLGYALMVQWQRTLYTGLLESWGLPRELYAWSEQLRALKLPSAVNRVDWLHKARSLEHLDLSGTRVQTLEGLPSGIRSLDLSFTATKSLGDDLPSSLRALSLRSTPLQTLQGIPRELLTLDLRGAPVDALSGLPPGLVELSLEADDLPALEGLPDSLRILALSRFSKPALGSLPPRIESLSLAETQLRSLEDLPSSLRTLTLVNNGELRFTTAPSSLKQLTIDLARSPVDLSRISGLQTLSLARVGIRALPEDPSSLQTVALAETSVRDLTWLPGSLRSLSIVPSGPEIPLTTLPPSLESLSLPWSQDLSLQSLPRRLKSLDLSFSRLSTLEGLPQGLERLTLNNADVPQLGALPSHLKELNLQSFRNRQLPNLPSGLKKLDLSGARRLSRLDQLPASLEELNVSHTNLSRLGPLPTGLRRLDVSDSPIESLAGKLPPVLERLRLNPRQFRGLDTLPGSLRELEIVDESESTPLESQARTP